MLLMALISSSAWAQTTVFSETFDSSSIPSGWTQVQVNGTVSWTMALDGSNGMGSSDYAAKFYSSTRGVITKLITPTIDLSSYADYAIVLSFNHRQKVWGSDQDQLRIYYRTSSNGSWTQVADYSSEVSSVTTQTVLLPAEACTSTCQIAFEGQAQYGYGVFVDDVYVKYTTPTIYTISNSSDWTTLKTNVENGTVTNIDIVKLNDDITVTSMVGTSDSKPFKGIFDGQGHTLTFNSTTSESYCAPFRYANGATFRNLKVSGTISTSNQFAAGFVGQITGNGCTFNNCVSNITIASSRNGDGTHGGFVANIQQGTNNFNGCAFTGSFTTSNGTTNCGGFAGWCETNNSAKIFLTDCVFAPSNTNFTSGCQTFFRIRSNSSSNCGLTNCYYYTTFGTAQGTQAYKVTLAANPAEGGTVDGGTPTTDYGCFAKAYNHGIYCGDNGIYYATGSVSLSANANEGYTFTKWSDNNTDNPRSISVSSDASYTAVFSSSSAFITEIASVADWNAFCAAVNGGHDYAGETVRMTADVTDDITTMAGTVLENDNHDPDKAFAGTFDGQGHILNLNLGANQHSTAPFRCIDGATIKNIHVTGTIATDHMRPASIAGYIKGNSTIENCWSEVAISSSYNSDIDGGGFVARVNSGKSVTLKGCVFTGSITYSNADGYEGGGMVGWTQNNANAILNDCLFAPTSIRIIKYKDHYMLVGGKTQGTLTNCYYNAVAAESDLTATNQGKQAYSITPGTEVSVENAGIATTYGGTTTSTHYITGYDTGIKYNNVLYAGNGEQVSLNLYYTGSGTLAGYTASNGGSISSGITNPLTLTMPNNNTVISASTISFIYEIYNTDDWNAFAQMVRSGHSYSGETVHLRGNVSITSQANQAGAANNFFKGTFEGHGHTITLNITATGDHCAPFYGISSATFNDLIVTGSITSEFIRIAGISSNMEEVENGGDCTFTNCISSVNFTSTKTGSVSCGGFIGHSGSWTDPVFVGCAFTGSITAVGDDCAGFIGFHISHTVPTTPLS